MKLTLKIWRQKNFETKGRIVNYQIDNISPDMSFLEMLDVLNADLISKDEFDLKKKLIILKMKYERRDNVNDTKFLIF